MRLPVLRQLHNPEVIRRGNPSKVIHWKCLLIIERWGKLGCLAACGIPLQGLPGFLASLLC